MLGEFLTWVTIIIGGNNAVVPIAPNMSGIKVPAVVIKQEERDQIEKLVVNLGSESFGVREKASMLLIDLGHKALPQVKTAHDETVDLEVKTRASKILVHYYFPVIKPEIYGIWSMPKRFRYVNDHDVAPGYYEKARLIYNEATASNIDKNNWGQMNVSQIALSLYIMDRIQDSPTDIREELLELKKETSDLREKLFATDAAKRAEGVYHSDPNNEIPGPIEDRTEALSKMPPPPKVEPEEAPEYD